jgi:hypothetical protein
MLQAIVVEVQLGTGIGLMGGGERLLDVIVADDRPPRRPPQRAVILERFVDDVPSQDAAPIAAYHRGDVMPHPFQQELSRSGFAVSILEHHGRRLLVPYQRMADDRQPVPRPHLDEAVRLAEVELARRRLRRRPFQRILRGDAGELPGDERGPLRTRVRIIRGTEGRADQERAGERVFEHGIARRGMAPCRWHRQERHHEPAAHGPAADGVGRAIRRPEVMPFETHDQPDRDPTHETWQRASPR